jgi:hypothetical protein
MLCDTCEGLRVRRNEAITRFSAMAWALARKRKTSSVLDYEAAVVAHGKAQLELDLLEDEFQTHLLTHRRETDRN